MKLLPNLFEDPEETGHNDILPGGSVSEKNTSNPDIQGFGSSGSNPSGNCETLENSAFILKKNIFEDSEHELPELQAISSQIRPKNAQIGMQSVDSLANGAFLTGKKTRKPYVSQIRGSVGPPRESSKKQKVNLNFSIAELKRKPCCTSHCSVKFTPSGVSEIRTTFWGTLQHPTKSEEQKSMISKWLVKWADRSTGGSIKFRYFFENQSICYRAMENLLPVSKNRMIQIRNDIKTQGTFFTIDARINEYSLPIDISSTLMYFV